MEHPDSDAAHRFTGYHADFLLYPGKSVTIWYDITSTRWRLIGSEDDDDYYGIVQVDETASSVTAGDWGTVSFVTSGTSSSNGASSSYSSIPNHWLHSTGTTSSGYAAVQYPKNTTYFSGYADAHLFAGAYLSIPTLSNGTNRFIVASILTASSTASVLSNNTVGIRYSDDLASGNWQGYVISNAGAVTTVDLGVAVVAETKYKIETCLDKAKGEARFYVNGVYRGKIDATPLNGLVDIMAKTAILKTVGTSGSQLQTFRFTAKAIYP